MSLWLALLGMTAVTFALRASFLLLPSGVETPALLRRALRYVPATVLTAIWVPPVFFEGEALSLSIHNEQLLAGAVAIAVAWRSRLTFATIASGLLALHLFAWLI